MIKLRDYNRYILKKLIKRNLRIKIGTKVNIKDTA
jgi:hypothetical protein